MNPFYYPSEPKISAENKTMTVIKNNLFNVPMLTSSILIRKSSFHSLIEIPTYVTCHTHITHISLYSDISPSVSHTHVGITLVDRLSAYQPIISEETRNNMQLLEQRVMCMATVFFICCLMMVGTMFVVTSQYQDMVVATMINVGIQQLNTTEAMTK